MKRIKHIGVFQTAKVAGMLYFLISAVFIAPFMLYELFSTSTAVSSIGGVIVFIFAPFVYALFGFVMTALACYLYNHISVWTGGIEVEFEEVADQTPQAKQVEVEQDDEAV